MKRSTILLMAAAVALLFASCSQKTYYQMYQTRQAPQQSMQAVTTASNGDYTVVFNFFAPNGNTGFTVTNNSDRVLSILLDQSFLVINGQSHAFFQNRVWETTERFRTTSTKTQYVEMPVITIAPHASYTVECPLHLQEEMIAICGIKDNPGRKTSGTTFTVENSPVKFSYYITMGVAPNATELYEASFYVDEIVNVNESTMIVTKHLLDECGKENGPKVNSFTLEGADRFYIPYVR
ncbi:MAG: hypothetical protein II532_04610 [Bacteroidales bacterium]|nr:hypothetical protein [Bacteroidales bacterium]